MRLFGLIGKPLGHSFSQAYFTEKFAREGLHDHVYRNFCLCRADFLPELVFREPCLSGLNVTSPYKQEVMEMLDALSPEAAAVGAVNVIALDRSRGRAVLTGHNTDTLGFDVTLRACRERRDTLSGPLPPLRNALVLGTGGAAAAVRYVLERRGLSVQTVSRTGRGDLTYASLTADDMAAFQVVVQATPLGMYPAVTGCPALPFDGLQPGTVCIDLVYNPARTVFMAGCERRRCVVAGGLEMLHAQAEASWRIWND